MALKDIARRIKGVKSTQKITKGMKTISQIRLQKAEKQAVTGRSYAGAVERLMNRISSHVSAADRKSFPLLNARATKSILLFVVSSDRGLAGNLNSSLIRGAQQKIDEWQAQGKTVSVIPIGVKGYMAFRRTELKMPHHFTHIPSPPTTSLIERLVQVAIDAFDKGEADEVWVVYNKFVTISKRDVTASRFLPLVIDGEGRRDSLAGSNQLEGRGRRLDPPLSASAPQMTSDGLTLPDFIFEPSPREILGKLIPLSLEVHMGQVLRDASASEFSARMLAMDQATTNSERMIDELTLVYNKARQAAITTQIIEVVSGAEALA